MSRVAASFEKVSQAEVLDIATHSLQCLNLARLVRPIKLSHGNFSEVTTQELFLLRPAADLNTTSAESFEQENFRWLRR